jgi:VWFA-related protein
MLKYLTDLKPSGARMAVLAIGNDLAVLQDFTTDLSSLQTAVRNYKRGRTQADLEALPVTLKGADQGLLDLFAQRVANDEQDTRVRITLASLQGIAESVAGYPGRKSLIWMSSSFPFTLSFGKDVPSPFELYKSYADDVRKTTALLTDSNVAVYPIDAHGLLSSGGVADVTTVTGSPDESSAPSTDLSAEAFKNFRSDETINSVADDTGGKVFRNTNDLTGAVKAAIADSESRYVLGFYLDQEKVDGKFHTIRVKVNRPGVKVRSRAGYFALDADNWRKRQDGSITPEFSGLAATGVLFEATPTAPKSPGQPARVDIVIDASTVSFGLGPAFTHPVDLSFEVAALKPDGKPEHVETRSAAAELKDSAFQQFMQTGIPLQIDMPLPSGRYLLRVTIRDNRTGHIGSLDMPLSIS